MVRSALSPADLGPRHGRRPADVRLRGRDERSAGRVLHRRAVPVSGGVRVAVYDYDARLDPGRGPAQRVRAGGPRLVLGEGGMTPIRVGFVLHAMQVAGAEMLVFETIRR